MKKLAVLASGGGSNFQALIDAQRVFKGEIAVLLVDRECYAVKRAEKNNIPVIKVIRKNYMDNKEFNKEMLKAFEAINADFYLLAGFMSILPSEIVDKYQNKIINIHPSLLPAFPGVNAIKQAFDYGVKYTGCSIHFVDCGLDTGPIIAQDIIAISEQDTLEKLTGRIHKLEHQLYVKVVKKLCTENIEIDDRKVSIKGGFDED